MTVLAATEPADLYLYFNMHNRRCNQKLAPLMQTKQHPTKSLRYQTWQERKRDGVVWTKPLLYTVVHCTLLIILCLR